MSSRQWTRLWVLSGAFALAIGCGGAGSEAETSDALMIGAEAETGTLCDDYTCGTGEIFDGTYPVDVTCGYGSKPVGEYCCEKTQAGNYVLECRFDNGVFCRQVDYPEGDPWGDNTCCNTSSGGTCSGPPILIE